MGALRDADYWILGWLDGNGFFTKPAISLVCGFLSPIIP